MNSYKPMFNEQSYIFAEAMDLDVYARNILTNSTDSTDRANAQYYLNRQITTYDYFNYITYRSGMRASRQAISDDRPNIYAIATTEAKAEVNRERINYVDPTFKRISDDVVMIFGATQQNTEMIGDLADTVDSLATNVGDQAGSNWWSNLFGGILGGFGGGFSGFLILGLIIFLVAKKI